MSVPTLLVLLLTASPGADQRVELEDLADALIGAERDRVLAEVEDRRARDRILEDAIERLSIAPPARRGAIAIALSMSFSSRAPDVSSGSAERAGFRLLLFVEVRSSAFLEGPLDPGTVASSRDERERLESCGDLASAPPRTGVAALGLRELEERARALDCAAIGGVR